MDVDLSRWGEELNGFLDQPFGAILFYLIVVMAMPIAAIAWFAIFSVLRHFGVL